MTDQKPVAEASRAADVSADGSLGAHGDLLVRPAERHERPTPGPASASAPERASFVYAIGRIEPRFPSLAVEKEFAQVIGRTDNAGRNDRQTFRQAISTRENRYLARSLCWVFVVQTLETYLLLPHDPADLDLLLDSYREELRADDLDVVIGVRGPLAPPEMCNGLAVPVVIFDQIYSFSRDALIDSIPAPHGITKAAEAKFRSTSAGLLAQLAQLADNAGATDDHRALNYLLMRYPQVYAVVAENHDRDMSFTGVEVRRSPLSGVRTVVEVIFSFRNRRTDMMEKQFVRVDMSEEYPFLVTPMSPFFDR